MVLPRKKAASADDINRASDQDLESAEDVWSKRSRDLAAAKKQKATGKM